jgi:hypothetical protein
MNLAKDDNDNELLNFYNKPLFFLNFLDKYKYDSFGKYNES